MHAEPFRRFGAPLAAALAILQGCEVVGSLDPALSRTQDMASGAAADPSLVCSPTLDVPLLAGRTQNVGRVSVANDQTTLFVTFTTEHGWTLESTALYAGTNESGIPVTSAGAPQVGRFPFRTGHAGGTTGFMYALPTPGAGGDIVIAAFAEVRNGDRQEGAWADGERISATGPWATFFRHAPSPCGGRTIGASGGSIAFGSMELVIPPGALTGDVDITVRPIDPPAGPLPGDVFLLDGTSFDLGPDGLEFLSPFEIRIGYDPSTLPAGVVEESLGIFQLNAGVVLLPGAVDTEANLVIASGDHFSSFGVGILPGEADPFIPVACPDLSLGVAAAMPLDAIEIGRLPADWSEPLAAAVSDPAGNTGVAFVEQRADGTARLVVPLHPSASPDGGDVELRFNDGTFACPAIDFTIAALPAAPGEFAALVDVLQDVLADQVAEAGTSIESLISTDILELPPTAWPLVVVQSVLDHPGNSNSLRALADGTAPFTTGVDLALADRLLARTGLRAGLTAASLAATSATSARTGASSTAAVAESVLECGPANVSDAASLDFCMRKSSSAAFRMEGASNQVLNDLGLAVGVAGVIPHPATKAAATVAGMAIWSLQHMREGVANLLPSAFVELQFQAAPLEFFEDQAGPGEWFDAQVIATSAGWALDKLALDLAFQAVGGDGIGSWVGRHMDPGVGADIASLLATEAVNSAIGSTEGSDHLEIAPALYGPFDVSDPAWAVAFVNGAAIELASETTYEPVAVGSATLDVRIRNEGGQFGGKTISSNDPVEIEVLQLDIDITPEEVTVKPGDPVEFNVVVTNSAHPEMVDVQASHGTANIFHLGAGQHRVAYTAPGASGFPDLVTARHTATTGARGAANAPERTATATVRAGSITISPREACLEPGDPLAFSAEVEGFSDPSIVWSASIGEIDESSGAYTATTTGTAIITATSVENPGISDQVAIQVGGCVCSWSVLVDGVLAEGEDGDYGEFRLTADAAAIENLIVSRGDATGSIVAAFTTLGGAPLPIGATGTFPIVATGEGDLAAGSALGFTSLAEEGTSVDITVTENDGEVLAGTITGSVFFFEPFPDGRTVSFLMPFRITRDPLESTALLSRCTIGTEGPTGSAVR